MIWAFNLDKTGFRVHVGKSSIFGTGINGLWDIKDIKKWAVGHSHSSSPNGLKKQNQIKS